MEIRGISAKFYVRSNIAAQGLKSSDEVQLIEKLVQILRPGDCVYDIGAGVGLHTLFLAQVVGARGLVVAFEPASHIYEYLYDNLMLNRSTNVRALKVALGDRNISGNLELTGSPRLLRSGSRQETHELVQSVKVVVGDLLVENMRLRIPRVVKIDVEGYEYAVIRGLSTTLAQNVCETVCCEIHPHMLPEDVKKEQVLDLLQSLGFCRIEIYRCRLSTYHALCYKA
jgi:FkbM family methyltransferase